MFDPFFEEGFRNKWALKGKAARLHTHVCTAVYLHDAHATYLPHNDG